MVKIKAGDVQKLREATGAGVMECQKALKEANGDFTSAVKFINQWGAAKVEKRAGRDTRAGLIYSYVHNERIGVLLDIRAETDFVVRSEPFRKLAQEIAMQIAASAPSDAETLLKEPYIRDESKTVQDTINEVIAKVGENVSVNKFFRIEL